MKIFLSHNSKDKEFVRILASDLKTYGLQVWFDEWEIKVGDSLMKKISEGIEESSCLIVVLSTKSIESSWVQNELSAAMSVELEKKEVFILPVLIDDCKIPVLLRDKLYADFRKEYNVGLKGLLNKFGVNEYGSQKFEFPEKIRLKKNKNTNFKYRYNLVLESEKDKVQKLAFSLYGLDYVEDIRIVNLSHLKYNLYIHTNHEMEASYVESLCLKNGTVLVKFSSLEFD